MPRRTTVSPGSMPAALTWTSTSPVLDVLVAQVQQYTRDGSHRIPLLFDMFADAGRNPATARMLHQHSETMRKLLGDLLRRGQEAGEVDRSMDADAVAPVLIGIVDAAKVMLVRYPEQPIADTVAMLRLLIARYLSAELNDPRKGLR